MSIPEIYLIEPYNAYAPKGRKKHWHEIVEEQALMARILAEQIAQQQSLLEASSKTNPPNSPATSTPTVGSPAGNAAGAGGTPVWDFWNPSGDSINFDRTPSAGDAPVTVAFTNPTTTPQFDQYLWTFGDGITSTEINPTHVYQTGSTDDYVYTASLQVTNSVTGIPGGVSPNVYTMVGIPSVTASFTVTTSSNVAPFTASFVNTTINTSQTPTTTYLWTIQNGNTTTTTSTTDLSLRIDSGSFTASLQATGSYNIAASTSSMNLAPAPTLNISFTVDSSSIYAPALVNLTPTTISYNGIGTLTGTWFSGEWAEGGSEYNLPYAGVWDGRLYDTRSGAAVQDGKFTASLQITESVYGIAARYTQSFALQLPSVTASFTFTTSSNTAPSTATFVNTSTYKTSSYAGESVTYLWSYGSASLSSSSETPTTLSYTAAGPYTASLQLTESLYGFTSYTTRSWLIA